MWLILPISIFGGFKSCSTYIEAETYLTPYSVQVSGYYRKDGKYIRPHKRRPPGSVKRDAPWEEKRNLMTIAFLGSIALFIASLYYTDRQFLKLFNEKKSRIDSIIINRKNIHKDIFIDNLRKNLIDKTNFEILPEYPQYLMYDNLWDCAYKHKDLPRTNFHVEYKAIKYTYRVCLEHVNALPSIGRGQPRTKYEKEIAYYIKYKELMEQFIYDFEIGLKSGGYSLSIVEIKSYFYKTCLERTATKT